MSPSKCTPRRSFNIGDPGDEAFLLLLLHWLKCEKWPEDWIVAVLDSRWWLYKWVYITLRSQTVNDGIIKAVNLTGWFSFCISAMCFGPSSPSTSGIAVWETVTFQSLAWCRSVMHPATVRLQWALCAHIKPSPSSGSSFTNINGFFLVSVLSVLYVKHAG